MQAMRKSGIWSKLLMAVLSVALVFTMMPLSMGTVYAEDEPVVLTIVDTDGTPAEFTMAQMEANVKTTTTTIGDTEVEGFIVKNLLKGYDENAVATVSTVDNYSDVNASGKTVSELRNNNYILAYREGDKNLRNTEVKDKKTGEVYGIGNFYLYAGNGDRDKWVNKIVLTASEEPVDPPEPVEQDPFLTVTGNALKSDVSFATLDELMNNEKVKAKIKEDVVFNWKNSYDTEGTAKVTGITIADLIQIAGLKDNMEVKELKATASDGWEKTYPADKILKADRDNNLAMYAWTYWASDKNKTETGQQRIIVGQFEAGEINQSTWGKKINKIEVVGEEKAVEPVITPAPVAKVIPKAPKIKTQSKGAKNAMIVSWGKVKNATSYKVMYRKAGSKWATKATKGTTLWIKGLKKGNMYEVKAIAVGKDGKSKASNVVYRYYKPAYKVKLTAKKKAVKVSWKKDAKASGYQVFYSTSKNMKNAKKVTVKGKTKCTISKLVKGKRYYVKVRPYITKNGHTYLGTMSRTKSVKTR